MNKANEKPHLVNPILLIRIILKSSALLCCFFILARHNLKPSFSTFLLNKRLQTEVNVSCFFETVKAFLTKHSVSKTLSGVDKDEINATVAFIQLLCFMPKNILNENKIIKNRQL